MTIGRAPAAGTGKQIIDADWVLGLAGGDNAISQTVTALAGGAQAGSPVIGVASGNPPTEAALINIGTVVSGNDSVQLPQAIAGRELSVLNMGAQTARVYANGTINKATGALDTIAGVANGTPVTVAANATLYFFCPVNGTWGQK